jgi:hypothetical protein
MFLVSSASGVVFLAAHDYQIVTRPVLILS